MESADAYLSDPEVDDAALDFVEQEVGRLRFDQNWPAMKDKAMRATRFVKEMGYTFPSSALIRAVQRLWQERVQWRNPYPQRDV